MAGMTTAHRKARILLIVLQAFVGLMAVLGALALLARPDGSLLRMQPAWLIGFESYTLPALMLLGLGLFHLVAAFMTWRYARGGIIAAQASGALLVLWIAVQTVLMRPLNVLEGIALLVGGAIFTIASELVRAEGGGEPAAA
jgi:hypothetical protein